MPDASYDMFDVYPASSALSNSEHIAWPITDADPSESASNIPADTSVVQTIKVHDPFLGGAKGDWSAPGANRFGQLNNQNMMRSSSGILGAAPADAELGQDRDASGLVTDQGLILPAPVGTTGNSRGAVESLAELGRIHTGLQVDGQDSVPFRSVRLQPRHPEATAHLESLPDWLLLDLFALPTLPGEDQNALLHRPGGRGGLVNINSAIEPFTSLTRNLPLEALLKINAHYTDSIIASTVANIRARTAANDPHVEGVLTGDHYRFTGELAEVTGIADGGEESEQRLSGLVDLASTRSSVYTVWSLGQSIVQVEDGGITVRASSSQVSYLERTESGGTIRFHIIQSTPLGLW